MSKRIERHRSIDRSCEEEEKDDDENVRNVESVREKRGEARVWGGGVDGWW